MEFQYFEYTVRLSRDGAALHFDRLYKGIESSKISHVFDNRADDPFRTHRLDAHTVAVQVHWCCVGRSANAHELASLKARIASVVA